MIIWKQMWEFLWWWWWRNEEDVSLQELYFKDSFLILIFGTYLIVLKKNGVYIASLRSSWVYLFIISKGVVPEHVPFHIKIVDNVFPRLQGKPPLLPVYKSKVTNHDTYFNISIVHVKCVCALHTRLEEDEDGNVMYRIFTLYTFVLPRWPKQNLRIFVLRQ